MQIEFLICPYCGFPSPYVCLACGKPQQPGWVVCPYCRSKPGEQGRTAPQAAARRTGAPL